MNRKIVYFFVVLICLAALASVLPPAGIYREGFEGSSKAIYGILIISGIVLYFLINYFGLKYPVEFEQAHKKAKTPYTKYGLYAVYYCLFVIILFGIYILITK